jgi:hypothetical protein
VQSTGGEAGSMARHADPAAAETLYPACSPPHAPAVAPLRAALRSTVSKLSRWRCRASSASAAASAAARRCSSSTASRPAGNTSWLVSSGGEQERELFMPKSPPTGMRTQPAPKATRAEGGTACSSKQQRLRVAHSRHRPSASRGPPAWGATRAPGGPPCPWPCRRWRQRRRRRGAAPGRGAAWSWDLAGSRRRRLQPRRRQHSTQLEI